MLGLLRTARLAPTAKLARAASTVGGALDEAVERLPHKEALRSIKQELRWSFKELNAIVDEVAFGLHSLKFEPGNVLAVWLPNNAESVSTCLCVCVCVYVYLPCEPRVYERLSALERAGVVAMANAIACLLLCASFAYGCK